MPPPRARRAAASLARWAARAARLAPARYAGSPFPLHRSPFPRLSVHVPFEPQDLGPRFLPRVRSESRLSTRGYPAHVLPPMIRRRQLRLPPPYLVPAPDDPT